MIGKSLRHFRIDAKLGAGGMGEVYLAHDERLERDVALKVLPARTLADETARKRFRKEALALSKLNHPNIATIYDFDTQDGVDFLVMEYVEGTTLSEKLSNGPLPEEEVTKLGRQVADALEEAHERGVIHRDLKPGNVMVTAKGQAKVLDFGLAKLKMEIPAAARSAFETSGVSLDSAYLADLNAIIRRAEQQLAPAGGLPGRPWYRHTVYAPGYDTGYGVKTLPGVREAVERRDWGQARSETERLERAIENYAARIDAATEVLEWTTTTSSRSH